MSVLGCICSVQIFPSSCHHPPDSLGQTSLCLDPPGSPTGFKSGSDWREQWESPLSIKESTSGFSSMLLESTDWKPTFSGNPFSERELIFHRFSLSHTELYFFRKKGQDKSQLLLLLRWSFTLCCPG